MVDKAKATLGELVDHLAPYADQNIPIIGLEPSCLFTLKDEALVMGFGERAVSVSKKAQLLEEFLASEVKAGTLQLKLKASDKPVLFHGHCHQKSFAAVTPATELLKLIPNAEPKLIESSCCGMAGSFGYEAEHIEVSKQMAEASLLPSIRKSPDSWWLRMALAVVTRLPMAHKEKRFISPEFWRRTFKYSMLWDGDSPQQ